MKFGSREKLSFNHKIQDCFEKVLLYLSTYFLLCEAAAAAIKFPSLSLPLCLTHRRSTKTKCRRFLLLGVLPLPPSQLPHSETPPLSSGTRGIQKSSLFLFSYFFRKTEICFFLGKLLRYRCGIFLGGRSSTKTSRKMGNKLFFGGNGEKVGLHLFLLFRATIVGCFCSNLNNAKSTTCGKKLCVVAPPPPVFPRQTFTEF